MLVLVPSVGLLTGSGLAIAVILASGANWFVLRWFAQREVRGLAEALRQARQTLTNSIEATDDGLALWDQKGRLLLCNDRYRDFFGACGGAMRGLGGEGIERQLADGRWLRWTERHTADGHFVQRFTDISSEKLREQDMRLWWEYLEGQTRDLDGLTRALSDAKRIAEEANRAKSIFLAGMSHELRTPLNGVLGFAEIIRDQIFGRHDIDRYSTYAADIHASGLHLLTLINDILDLSKVEAGKMELREEIVDLESIVSSSFNLMGESAMRGRVTLRRLARERTALRADGMKLKQCLLNVLSNAIKFTPPDGAVTLSVNVDAEHLTLSVRDTGIGIGRDDLAKVFEPFQQIDGELTGSLVGTGLGMSLTKSFIEMHGGMIEIDSEVGRGTIVHLRLPVSRVVAQEIWDPQGLAIN
jgi:two-component system cell cycle sensor histidine kinase PleC